MSRVSGGSGDFPAQLATRLPGWSEGGMLRCIVLPVSCNILNMLPCIVLFSKFPEPDMHDLLRTSR